MQRIKCMLIDMHTVSDDNKRFDWFVSSLFLQARTKGIRNYFRANRWCIVWTNRPVNNESRFFYLISFYLIRYAIIWRGNVSIIDAAHNLIVHATARFALSLHICKALSNSCIIFSSFFTVIKTITNMEDNSWTEGVHIIASPIRVSSFHW